jgi:multidrug efflux system outer membrane protein
MYKIKIIKYSIALSICLAIASCDAPAVAVATANKAVPESFDKSKDTTNTSNTPWRTYFKDPNLVSLIDTALKNNQELQITLQDIEIAKNDIRVKKGTLLPTIGAGAGAGVEKVGKYTSQGAGDSSAQIMPGQIVPEALHDYRLGLYANWEVDIWKKLRNSKSCGKPLFIYHRREELCCNKSYCRGRRFVL